MLKKNQTLLHMDLSHNEITEADSEIISVGLNKNRTLLGLHMTGNYVNTNAEGFLDKQKPHPASDSHIMTRLTESLAMGYQTSPIQIDLRATSNCWICEGWSEVKFMFDLTTADVKLTPEDGELKGVNIHLDFDDYQPNVMKHSSKNENLFYIVRMVPPRRKVRYYFSIATEKIVPKTPPPEKPNKDVTKNGMIVFKKPKSKRPPAKIKMKKVMQFKNTINERDNLKRANLIDYQGLFIIPTLNQIEVPRTNMVENIAKNDRLIDSTYFTDTTTYPRPTKISIDNKVEKDEWNKNKSVFRNFHTDTPSLLKKCFEEDYANSNISRIIKDEYDRNKVKEFLQSIYIPMRETYKYYAGTSYVKNVPSIGSNAMTELLTNANVIDNKMLKMADVDIDFIATNVGQKPPDPKWRYLNPDRLLVRDEFMQIFVRLAARKYLLTKQYLTYTDAVKALFKDGVLDYMKKFDSNEFRINKLYNESCDMVFKYYQKAMRLIYSTYSGKHAKPHEEKFMCSDEFIKLIGDSGVISDYFGAKDVGIVFNLSMMTQVNESTSERHLRMSYDEFIEAVARIADKCNLLLVSSSYFGIDLECENPIYTRRQTLAPEASEPSMFEPSNILKHQSSLKEDQKSVSENSIDGVEIEKSEEYVESVQNIESIKAEESKMVHPGGILLKTINPYSEYDHISE